MLRDQKVDLILHSKDLWNRLNDLVEQALAEPMADPSLVMNVPTRVADYGKQLEVLNWLLMSFGAGSSMPQSLPEEVERLVLDPPNTASGSSEKGSSSHGKSRTRGKKSSKSGRQKRR